MLSFSISCNLTVYYFEKLLLLNDVISIVCLQVWDRETLRRLVTLRNHTDGVTCLAFNDHVIVSGSYDKTVKLWDFSVCWIFLFSSFIISKLYKALLFEIVFFIWSWRRKERGRSRDVKICPALHLDLVFTFLDTNCTTEKYTFVRYCYVVLGILYFAKLML